MANTMEDIETTIRITKDIMGALYEPKVSAKIRSTFMFADIVCQNAFRMGAAGINEVYKLCSMLAVIKTDKKEYDGFPVYRIGYRLGNVSVARSFNEEGFARFYSDFSSPLIVRERYGSWLTSQGLYVRPLIHYDVLNEECPKGFFVPDPRFMAACGKILCMETQTTPVLNTESIYEYWYKNIRYPIMPIGDMRLSDLYKGNEWTKKSQDNLSLLVSLLTSYMLGKITEKRGQEGIDWLIYDIYRHAYKEDKQYEEAFSKGYISNMSAAAGAERSLRSWANLMIHKKDMEAILGALKSSHRNDELINDELLTERCRDAIGLGDSHMYSYKEFLFFLHPMAEIMTEIFLKLGAKNISGKDRQQEIEQLIYSRGINAGSTVDKCAEFKNVTFFGRSIFEYWDLYVPRNENEGRKVQTLKTKVMELLNTYDDDNGRMISDIANNIMSIRESDKYKQKNEDRMNYYRNNYANMPESLKNWALSNDNLLAVCETAMLELSKEEIEYIKQTQKMMEESPRDSLHKKLIIRQRLKEERARRNMEAEWKALQKEAGPLGTEERN